MGKELSPLCNDKNGNPIERRFYYDEQNKEIIFCNYRTASGEISIYHTDPKRNGYTYVFETATKHFSPIIIEEAEKRGKLLVNIGNGVLEFVEELRAKESELASKSLI